ncbi:O-antigen ligase domain-containing protein [Methylobacterium sp. ID0610]|uniref:O-antigen ligase domain-containing protein n=1 Tax=Methylobacterium carpenticola TaxID=3344827 RepID=UPI0036C3253A
MTDQLVAPAALGRSLPGWLAAALLLAGTALAGPLLGGASRPLFILGCAAVGGYAWRRSAAEHLQAALLLFAFAPFLRRVVDLSAGYEASGLMLVGPLLAVLAPLPGLRVLLDGDRPVPAALAAVFGVGACVAYGTALSLFQGEWMSAATGSIKWFAPLLYAAALALRPAEERPELVQAMASVFLAILPLTGLYGILQYVDPPAWDRYWMSLTPILSIGQPVPYGVRTFSTMNAPASFATFTVAGLLLVGFLRPGRAALLAASPAALALLLSMYRTAWISLAAGLLFCLLFQATRRRAVGVLVGVAAAVAVAATLTPFGEVIGDRLATLGSGTGDDSARERLEQYVTLWNLPDSGLIGNGFTVTDVGSAGAMAIDGMIVSCWVTMGIVVGMICIAALLLAAGRAIAAAWGGRAEAVVVGAMACGALVQIPLSNVASGELGVLFWIVAVLAPEGGPGGRA